MEFTKETIEGLIIMFYKLEEFDACWEVLQFYKKEYGNETTHKMTCNDSL